LLLVVTQTGCIAIGLTLLGAGVGVGTGTAVAYALNGYAYRTFAAPLTQVEVATAKALSNMGIKIEEWEETEQGKRVSAVGNERKIEVRLEEVTAETTRIRTQVRMGTFLKDRATATEIIIQTEEVLTEDVLARN
jgi:hypothetical protein